jgi:hypothetical protein
MNICMFVCCLVRSTNKILTWPISFVHIEHMTNRKNKTKQNRTEQNVESKKTNVSLTKTIRLRSFTNLFIVMLEDATVNMHYYVKHRVRRTKATYRRSIGSFIVQWAIGRLRWWKNSHISSSKPLQKNSVTHMFHLCLQIHYEYHY